MDIRGQPGQGKAKGASCRELSDARKGALEMGLKGVDARTEARMSSAPCRAVGLVFCRQRRERIQSKGVKHRHARADVL